MKIIKLSLIISLIVASVVAAMLFYQLITYPEGGQSLQVVLWQLHFLLCLLFHSWLLPLLLILYRDLGDERCRQR